MKLLPCQETVAHPIHSSQPFVILGMSHLSQNIPPDRFSIGAFKEQVVVILIIAETVSIYWDHVYQTDEVYLEL